MSVYVLVVAYDNANLIYGIYSSYELAKICAEKNGIQFYTIDEFELNQVE